MEIVAIKSTQGVLFNDFDVKAIMKGVAEGYTFKKFPFSLIILTRICSLSIIPVDVRKYYIAKYVESAPHSNQVWPSTHNCILRQMHALCTYEHFEIIIKDILSNGSAVERPHPSPLIIYSSIELFPMDEAYVYDLVLIVSRIKGCKPFTYLFKDNGDFALMAVRHYIFHVLKNTPHLNRSLFRDVKNMETFITNSLPFDLLLFNVKAIISQHKIHVTKLVDVRHGCINMALSAILD